MNQNRFKANLFANDTWVVTDTELKKEMCVVGSYEGEPRTAKERAKEIADSLNTCYGPLSPEEVRAENRRRHEEDYPEDARARRFDGSF